MQQAENALQNFISSDFYDYEEESGLAPRELNLPMIPEAGRGPSMLSQHQVLMAAIHPQNN